MFWVTGTDTGVGKTHVCVELVTWLRARTHAAIALKPVETGWNEETSDASRLARASCRDVKTTLWQHFQNPLAPAVAAEREGRSLEQESMLRWIEQNARGSDTCFVEGAGGWMVPFGVDWMFSDAAARSEAGVLVVGRATLGTINHSLLTLTAVSRTNPIVALVLSRLPDVSIDVARRNQDEIRRRVGVDVKIVPDEMPELGALFLAPA